MNEKMKEHISALSDNQTELSESLHNSLTNDPQALAYWKTIHLTRDAMQNEDTGILDADFANRVALAVQDEPVINIEQLPKAKVTNIGLKPLLANWAKPMLGFALAASLAALSVIMLKTTPNEFDDNTPRESLQVANNSGTHWVAENGPIQNPQAVMRLNALLSNHLEFATTRSVGGVLPYSRLVSYDEVDQ